LIIYDAQGFRLFQQPVVNYQLYGTKSQ